ncbi:hypothetical protein ACFWNN_18335 [Lentzea sp. NPDC058450]|uniref:hypothetical protein n=1 Tax=Lentzea sp. NPDC058450 TaxID=3346505 RepID=UPI0036687D8D
MIDPLAVLARETGCTADLTSEHGRWELYQVSFGSLDLLYPALAREPDTALLTSVLLHVLERTDDHARWLELAPDEYAVRRSREIGVLRRAADLLSAEFDLAGWSDWLQLRLAQVPSRDLLTALAEGGRTKRIRRIAAATQKGWV